MNFKNIFNNDTDMITNIFAVISFVWLMPIIIVLFILQILLVNPIKYLFKKIK